MFRKITGVLIALLCIGQAMAQNKTSKGFDFDFYGFIRNEFYLDTYKGADVIYDSFYLLPVYNGQDANGEDLNEQTSANLAAVSSRFGFKVHGPEFMGAKTTAVIETDFAGITKSEPTLLRIRHAFLKLNWEESELLIGQYWHPFWGGGTYPRVGSFNPGAPFQAFNRSPMLRYDYHFGNLKLGAAAVYDNQFTSKALNTGSQVTGNQANRNGVLPEGDLLIEYANDHWILGGGASVKRIKPRMTTVGTGGTFVADEFLTSYASMAYLKYQTEKLNITAKGFYGQNMAHLTMAGGYAVASVDEQTGAETYTNYSSVTSLLNIVYGKKWQVGMFAGYGKNLGTADAVYSNNGAPIVAGLYTSVMEMARGSVHGALNLGNVRFTAEVEVSSANYGVGDFDFSDGTYGDKHWATNTHCAVSMTYSF